MANENPLPQPEDIPWQLMCVSNDMLDPNKCNKKFPMPWKSSIAVSAYEPKEEDLPEPFCAGKITYLKITVSITGYQPTDEEIEVGYTELGNTPVEAALDDIFATYFGCYGVLLNVAIFPNSATNWDVKDFPKIISMEPKVRELVQAATESGELLTASKSGISTTKSRTTTEHTQTGISASNTTSINSGGNLTIPGTPVGVSSGFESENTAAFTHNWGSTTEDSTQVSANASQERSEKQAATTQIQQLYNMLSAYHLGTNRAVFLMLPRPHILQPTDRRTFVQGVRSIEGIQEFFLVVSRPDNMEGICVEAKLDTGHFPENIEVKEPPLKYKEAEVEFQVEKNARNGANILSFSGEVVQLHTVFTVPPGWQVDTRISPSPPHPYGDPGHLGITATDIGSNSQGVPHNYDYQAFNNDTQVLVSGYIQGANGFGSGAIFNKKYTVHLKSIDPLPTEMENLIRIAGLFVTTRSLCCCFYSSSGCLIKGPVPPNPPIPVPSDNYTEIVEQRELHISESLLSDAIAGKSLEPAIKGLLRQLKSIMITSRNHRHSHFEEGITFLDSDFFVKSILKHFPEDVKHVLLDRISELNENVKTAYGMEGTVEDALNDTLEKFILKTKLVYTDAVEQRRIILAQIKDEPV